MLKILAATIVAAVLGALVVTASPAADGFAGRETLQNLSGTFESTAPEPWYGGYGTRSFTFENGRWALTFVHALDPEMKQKTFRFRTLGPYRIGAALTKPEGAHEAIFGYDAKLVTLLTAEAQIATAFGFAGCGLKRDIEIDVSETGCANWKPIRQCGEDHDLLALDAAGLYFGVRPRGNDMCTPDKRPTALLMPVVKR
jgi:hypothetical protein